MDSAVSFLLTFTCAVHTVFGQLDPDIVGEVESVVASPGDSVLFNCTVVNLQDGVTSVYWSFIDPSPKETSISKDEIVTINQINNPICKEGKRKYEVRVQKWADDPRRITYSLAVSCVQSPDTGRFKCSIGILGQAYWDWPTKIGSLVVQAPPTISNKIDSMIQLDEGDNVTLVCTASGVPRPNITWVRSDGGMLPGGNRTIHRSGMLEFKNVSKNIAGVYRCTADNKVKPKDTYDVTIHVGHVTTQGSFVISLPVVILLAVAIVTKLLFLR